MIMVMILDVVVQKLCIKKLFSGVVDLVLIIFQLIRNKK
jgi:hypothetical protein